MKRTIALVLLALIVPAAAFAFDVTVGPRIGVASYQLYGDDIDDFLDAQSDAKRGLGLSGQIGAFAEIGVMPMLAVQPELLFTYGRPALKYDNAGDDASITFVTKTIDLPLLVKGKFDAGPVAAAVFAGPVVQMKVGTWKSIQDDGTNETDDDVPDDDLKTFAFGALVGGGVELPAIGPGKLMIDARFFVDLTGFADGVPIDFLGRAFIVGVGYGFDLM